jgi:hypothetical protein
MKSGKLRGIAGNGRRVAGSTSNEQTAQAPHQQSKTSRNDE